jgi:hypothetical protein
MASLINNCVFLATAGGTAAFGVSANVQGYQTPAAAGATDGKTYRYRAQSADLTQWEEGNTVSSGSATSFTRVVTVSSAGGTTTVNFTQPPNVMLTIFMQDILQFDDAMSLTAAQQAQARSNIGADFPSATVSLFYQASAPTGWTKVTTQNDKALRVVSGSGGVAGGTNAFSSVMAQSVVGSYTLTIADTPNHGHPYTAPGPNDAMTPFSGGALNSSGSPAAANTGAVGGGGAHNHTIMMSIQYIDIILASKN